MTPTASSTPFTRVLTLNPWWAEGMYLQGKITFPEIIEACAAMGVDGIDMNDIYLGDCPNPEPQLLRRVKRDCRAAGLEIATCWYYTDLAGAALLESPEFAVRHIARLLAVTEALDSPFLVISNGNLPEGTTVARARTALLNVYDKLAPLAEDHGIVIGFHAGRARSPFTSPTGALDLVAEFGSRYLSVTPDFEAWRRPTEALPTRYTDNPRLVQSAPLAPEVFGTVLPYAPVVHAKFLEINDQEDEPNYPLDELFAQLNAHAQPHNVCIEYEGWIPEVRPDRDPVTETKRCVEIVRRRIAA